MISLTTSNKIFVMASRNTSMVILLLISTFKAAIANMTEQNTMARRSLGSIIALKKVSGTIESIIVTQVMVLLSFLMFVEFVVNNLISFTFPGSKILAAIAPIINAMNVKEKK